MGVGGFFRGGAVLLWMERGWSSVPVGCKTDGGGGGGGGR